MPLTYDDLPAADTGHLQSRLRHPVSRRGVLRTAWLGGVGLAFGAFALVNRGVSSAGAAYFQDWTSTTTGPCATYAAGHTEEGIQCGPSAMCLDRQCCWRYHHGAGNRVGWHKEAPGRGGTYYLHRPDACYQSTYDSWHWKFSDGNTYRCSDGWTCSSAGCYRSICPWVV
ncbi:hypothetical protein [Ornithinimicrobium sediminis]|jgi:hypothetical protein|uniref:hypothetical protein n=1 Tax=Ornithinimicrobium sediminis TaxID=2904603 RepID=UPI001E2937DA|nr:hypothetical protein [Ornithinimicrobium sediminis]MCE0486117.1 hypothetical protein [Ornithinimicrobium sediminis]